MKIKFTFAMIAADTWSGVVSSILGTAVEDCVEMAIPAEDLLTEYTMLADGRVGTDTLIVLTSGGHWLSNKDEARLSLAGLAKWRLTFAWKSAGSC